MNIKNQIRTDTKQVGVTPYRQIHAHSTGNPNSTAQNEADYMGRKDLETGFFTHVVGNGQVIQTAATNRGAWDVGGGWNVETFAAVELIESHKTQAEFNADYRLYIELLRELAGQAGIPKTLDTSALEGVKTHNYCTYHQPNNNSDHVDPLPYLAKWGISAAQFAKDVANGMANPPKIQYKAHVSEIGWQSSFSDWGTAGTTGQKKAIEALVVEPKAGVTFKARGHVSGMGWLDWVSAGQVIGTTGKKLALEAIDFECNVTVEVQEHVASVGWLPVMKAKSGRIGTTGRAKALEAIRFRIV